MNNNSHFHDVKARLLALPLENHRITCQKEELRASRKNIKITVIKLRSGTMIMNLSV